MRGFMCFSEVVMISITTALIVTISGVLLYTNVYREKQEGKTIAGEYARFLSPVFGAVCGREGRG